MPITARRFRTRSAPPLAVAFVIAALLYFAPAARADFLPIINPSFEDLSRPLLIGEQTNGAGGEGVFVGTRFPFGGGPPGGGVLWDDPVEVPGWRTFLPPQGSQAVVHAGVLNPPLLGGQPFITGQDGTNVAALQVSKMGQTLNVQLQPNTHYHLSFLGGIGLFGTDYILNVSLIAAENLEILPLTGEPGITQLAITQGLVPPRESFGTMQRYTLDYTTPATLPQTLIGTYIGIQLWGSDGIPRVVYDDLQLEATTVPGPSVMMAMGAASLLLGRRRARNSASSCAG